MASAARRIVSPHVKAGGNGDGLIQGIFRVDSGNIQYLAATARQAETATGRPCGTFATITTMNEPTMESSTSPDSGNIQGTFRELSVNIQ
jgi:hypothetical protein